MLQSALKVKLQIHQPSFNYPFIIIPEKDYIYKCEDDLLREIIAAL